MLCLGIELLAPLVSLPDADSMPQRSATESEPVERVVILPTTRECETDGLNRHDCSNFDASLDAAMCSTFARPLTVQNATAECNTTGSEPATLPARFAVSTPLNT